MKNNLLLIFAFLSQVTFAQLNINNGRYHPNKAFPIVVKQTRATIVYDTTDFKVVSRSAELLVDDVHKITGQHLRLNNTLTGAKGNIILVGTLGKNRWIDQLAATGKLKVDITRGEWERFLIRTIEQPFDGVDKALIIAGSDARGTAYGVFSLSEAMGVSPWYFWSDVPVRHHKELYLDNLNYCSKAPSVKYRGIFINDEDWGMHPWASRCMDPSVGDIGPNTYERIFELLLRLKANMMAPAMHECTKAFYTVPGNMEMADKYGIMITTSHCEPLLYNNASEWDNRTQGEWNYQTNRKAIDQVLDARVRQAADKDNIYTIALRGKHDEGMKGGSLDEKFALLGQAIQSQRDILAKHIQKPIQEIPQIFVPYKEVLDIYEKGLQVPDDVTLVWPDDNYGYIKKLSNDKERQRSGGSGVYYHISYLGWPNDYLWLNTTAPALMYAEMHKAWSLGANRYWLLNVGDIKPGELGIQQFLDMAWDFDRFSFENINDHPTDFLTDIFGEQYRKDISHVLDRYYHLSFLRKPEYMTWDWRWNSLFAKTKIKDTEFSFLHYNEAEQRIQEYQNITAIVERILKELPSNLKPAFFELLYYPVKASALYNLEMLLAQKNRWYATQKRAATNELANQAIACHDSLESITTEFNHLMNDKWNGIITAPGFLPMKQYPPTTRIELPEKADMNVYVEGCTSNRQDSLSLPGFYKSSNRTHFFEIYNRGDQAFVWYASADKEWIELSAVQGQTSKQTRISVSINWNKLDTSYTDHVHEGEICLQSSDGSTWRIGVLATDNTSNPPHMYLVENGTISINPTRYQRKVENGGVVFQAIKGLGYCNSALQLGNAQLNDGKQSYVEYDFYIDKRAFPQNDSLTINIYMLPLFPKDKAHGASYGISLDQSETVVIDNTPIEYSNEWARNVLRNSTLNTITLPVGAPGRHTLRLYCTDPGMIAQKIVIDCGGLRTSYTGPQETYHR